MASHRLELDERPPLPPEPGFDPFTGAVLEPVPVRRRGRHAAPVDPAGPDDPDEGLSWPNHPTAAEILHEHETGIRVERGFWGEFAAAELRRKLGLPEPELPAPVFPYIPEPKDFRINWILAASLGMFGVDRFHRGRPVTGTLKLLTLGGAGIWWAWDQLSVATGHAVNGEGRPMSGSRRDRVLAFAASMSLIAAAGAFGVSAVLPQAEEATQTVAEAVAPPAPPEPVWEPLASLSGGPGEGPSEPFTVTGDGLRYDYTLDGAGFVYLLPAGTDSVPDGAEPLVATFVGETGSITQAPAPGEYILFVQSPEAGWSFELTQRVLR